MKQYVWMIIAIIVMSSVNASENPFDLNRNFRDIDQVEQQFLSDLKNIVKEEGSREKLEKNDTAQDKAIETIATKVTEKKAESIKKVKASVVKIETAEEKTARLQKIKKNQERREAERLAAEKAAQEAAELEKIKKAQAEKKAAAELAKLKAEKAALEKKMTEEEMAKKAVDEGRRATLSSQNVAEIDVAREAEEKSREAEKILEEAIREVDGD